MVVVQLKLADTPGRKTPVQVLTSLQTLFETDLNSLFLEFEKVLEERAMLAFEKEGYPIAWKPSQRVLMEGGKTLQLSGRLKNSFQKSNAEHIFEAIGKRMLWGSRVPYAPFHMSTDPRTKMPFRAVIVFDGTLQDRLQASLDAWAERKIQEAGA